MYNYGNPNGTNYYAPEDSRYQGGGGGYPPENNQIGDVTNTQPNINVNPVDTGMPPEVTAPQVTAPQVTAPQEDWWIDPATGQPYADENAYQQGMPPQVTAPQETVMGRSPWTNYNSASTGGGGGMGGGNYGASWNDNPSAGAVAGAADYEGVQDFSDAAYNNARRYLDPQQAQDNRRFDQELINRGIDPNSDYGQEMMAQMMRGHGDQDQGAAYGAMQFGQGIQEQMFRQGFDNTRQAGDMQKAQWADQTNRYQGDQAYDLGRGNLDVARQNQDFNEMGYYDSRDYRNQLYNDSRDDRYQNIAMWMYEQGNPQGGLGDNKNIATSPWGDYTTDLRNIWFPKPT